MSLVNKYLPVGSIVNVKKMKFPIMITGFCIGDIRKKDTLYDYSGCMYPLGIIDSNKPYLFQHEDIDKVIYYGYISAEYREFNTKLINVVDEHHDDLLPGEDELEVI